jgi:hypothetical protein
MQNDGEIQHLFAPQLTDKINQDDSVTKNGFSSGECRG